MAQLWGALIPSLLGGVVSSLLTLHFKNKSEERATRRLKLEELCGLLAELQNEVASAVSIAEIGNLRTTPDLPVIKLKRAYTLIYIYFPVAKPGFDQALQAMGPSGDLDEDGKKRTLPEVIRDLKRVRDGLEHAYGHALRQASTFHK